MADKQTAKFFFTPARSQNVAMVTNAGVTAVPFTHGTIIYGTHLNAGVTPETYSVYMAKVTYS